MKSRSIAKENIELVRRNCFAVIVDNEPGVLAKVIGLFSGRGYNIESLTVATVDVQCLLSRITIVTKGTQIVIAQIKAQLEKLVIVHEVHNVTQEGDSVEKEIALLRFAAKGIERREGLRIAGIFGAKVADTTHETFVFSISGSSQKIDAFIELMRDIGVVEIARSGIVSLNRGKVLQEN